MTATLTPATLAFREDGTPFSPIYGDVYHSTAGAFAQAQAVFLNGNALPQRWQDRRIFTVVETGFGMGVNFLATWSAWRDDPARCERLHFVSVEKHPFARNDLQTALDAVVAHAREAPLARELVNAWPMLVPGTHRLEFEGGRVTLTLVFGDALEVFPKMWMRADAIYLDGFAPAKNPDLWSTAIFKALARVAGEDATFATWSSSGDVKRALQQNGFEYHKVEGFNGKWAMLVGRFTPRWRVRRYEPPLPLALVPPMTLAIGVGVCEAACEAGADARLKWPNDVLASGRKLAGVLVEAQSQGSRLESVVVGIGVNLGGELPPELAARATTLAAAAGCEIDRARFIGALLGHVERWIDRYIASGLPAVIAAWHERMVHGIAARATVEGAPLEGEVAGLDGDGALLLRDGAGRVHRVRSGDVEVIRVMPPRVAVGPDPGSGPGPGPGEEPAAPAC